MKIYLVGGAVRDEALQRPVSERDWVVVGGTPAQLFAQGYTQVGRDFPVFLHPTTHEEYALARTERKLGSGYTGFTCDFNPHVTLEEDLARRDLTINAMAKDDHGVLVDPYHGMRDLAAKQLRHVSPAFVEDPVRVLRVARFAARYHHLGFTLADETRELMYAMVRRQELVHLVPERVRQEWQGALTERHPWVFLSVLRTCGALRVILPELDAMFGIPNPAHACFDIDAGKGMFRRLARAAALSVDPVIRFAALLVDLGKALTPMNDWPFHPGYEACSERVINDLCGRLRIPNEYRELAGLSARFQVQIRQGVRLGALCIVSVLEQTDAFRRPLRFDAVLTVCEAYGQDDQLRMQWLHLLDVCCQVSVKELVEQYKGEAIKRALQERRIASVELELNRWVVNEE